MSSRTFLAISKTGFLFLESTLSENNLHRRNEMNKERQKERRLWTHALRVKTHFRTKLDSKQACIEMTNLQSNSPNKVFNRVKMKSIIRKR